MLFVPTGLFMRRQIMGLEPAAGFDGSHPAVQVDYSHKADNREVHYFFPGDGLEKWLARRFGGTCFWK